MSARPRLTAADVNDLEFAVRADHQALSVSARLQATVERILTEHMAEAWDEAAEATADWMASNPSPAGIPQDPPRNPYLPNA